MPLLCIAVGDAVDVEAVAAVRGLLLGLLFRFVCAFVGAALDVVLKVLACFCKVSSVGCSGADDV